MLQKSELVELVIKIENKMDFFTQSENNVTVEISKREKAFV